MFNVYPKTLALVPDVRLRLISFEKNYWRERASFQRSAFGRSTAGNDVVATIFIHIFFSFFPPFFFPFFSRFFFSQSRPFLIEGVLGSKNLFSESCLECPKNSHFGAPWRPFWILQAVRRCRR